MLFGQCPNRGGDKLKGASLICTLVETGNLMFQRFQKIGEELSLTTLLPPILIVIQKQALEKDHHEVVTKLERGQKEAMSKLRNQHQDMMVKMEKQHQELVDKMAVEHQEVVSRMGEEKEEAAKTIRLLEEKLAHKVFPNSNIFVFHPHSCGVQS